MTDEQIIADVLAGDRHRFRMLVERHERVLLQYLHNLLPNRHDCEELAQEAFLRAFTHLASFDRALSSFRTWLLVIARRRALNVLAKHRPELSHHVPEVATEADPAARLTRHEQFEALDRALDSLPMEQRSAFVLAEIQELPYAEVAMIEGVPLGTVKSRVARARVYLRRVFSVEHA